MSRLYDNTAAVVLAWLLTLGCSSGPELGALGRDAVILAFGDSLTFGKGVSGAESYPAVLERLIGRAVVRSGVSGEVTRLGLERLPRVLAEYAPDLVIICHGGNDILRRLPNTRTRSNLAEMLALVRSSGADAVLVAVPGRSLSLAPPSFYAEVAQSQGAVLVDDVVREVLLNADLKSDSVHPNAAGYDKIAHRIAEVMRERGAI